MLIRRAEVSLARRRFDQVESDARLALDATARLLGPDALSADNGRAYFLLGQALREQGRAAEAAKAFAEAARQFQPTLGEDHPRTLEALRLAPRN